MDFSRRDVLKGVAATTAGMVLAGSMKPALAQAQQPGGSKPTPFGRNLPPNQAYLAKQAPEPILEADLPIMDTHHHLYERHEQNYRYLLHELLADVRSGHNTVATVFVEANSMYRARGPEEFKPVGETEFVAGVAAMAESGIYGPTRVCAGIVGHANLALGDRVEPVLEALIRAGGGRFRGIRYSTAWDADPIIGNSRGMTGLGGLVRPEVRAGLARLTALSLSLDAWVFHPQLQDIIDVARAFPNTTIVVNHVGGPLGYGPYAGKRDEVFAAWKPKIVDMAKCPNVFMKLGGMMMRLAAYDYGKEPVPPTSEQLAKLWGPWMQTCIEQFGANRCTFESNFPVEKMGVTWAVLWNAFKRIASGASAAEKQALFAGTARRAYRLA